ncbi:hypothetical protein OR263_21500 [Streptomyces sp. NEAU-H22]|uniref:hypothetical protein n=1 Tax=unclassified Streptomyces TaxID=2593676 RepID=UPI00224E390F|nr:MULTISPECIES: hypothetical protein [unclassified Streptomyces]MCX3289251.1 hypothetical protein [Streptomyces sp. NEAU-H22]WMD07526.1 hypothetical protein Q7C01_25555 [Streptomyces sp. FXY-T5]
MSEEAEIRGTARKVGEQTVEVYTISLDLDDASREKLMADPSGVMRRFLESQGYTVNALKMPELRRFEDEWPSGWHHIPSGPEKSHWFPIYL